MIISWLLMVVVTRKNGGWEWQWLHFNGDGFGFPICCWHFPCFGGNPQAFRAAKKLENILRMMNSPKTNWIRGWDSSWLVLNQLDDRCAHQWCSFKNNRFPLKSDQLEGTPYAYNIVCLVGGFCLFPSLERLIDRHSITFQSWASTDVQQISHQLEWSIHIGQPACTVVISPVFVGYPLSWT